MSSEAGALFPLNRLSVFDFGPLSPTNRGPPNTTAAARRRFSHADVNGPSITRGGPLTPKNPLYVSLRRQPPRAAPSSTTRVAARAHTQKI